MWNFPSKEDLSVIPQLYETEKITPKNKIVHMHFFFAGCDWYAVEFDGEEVFFGYAILNGDYRNAEWGYFSLSELSSIKKSWMEVDRDLHWQVRKACEVAEIAKTCGWEVDHAL